MEHLLRGLVVIFIAGPILVALVAITITAAVRSIRIPSCPKCGRPKVRRSQRDNFTDFAVGYVGLLPYRCRSCLRRFYAFRTSKVLLAASAKIAVKEKKHEAEPDYSKTAS